MLICVSVILLLTALSVLSDFVLQLVIHSVQVVIVCDVLMLVSIGDIRAVCQIRDVATSAYVAVLSAVVNVIVFR